jgi:hypothetical protein
MMMASQSVSCPCCLKEHVVFGAWCEDGTFAFEWECVGPDGCGVTFNDEGVVNKLLAGNGHGPGAVPAGPVAEREAPWWARN